MNFGLYIHWPFCIKKCPYCDFNSYAFKYEENIWIDGILKEIKTQAAVFKDYKLSTIFFGGGTPSLISPHHIENIIETAQNLWQKEDQKIEITIEINPSSIETYKLEQFLKAGINRFSIGMQSLDDEDLKFLGRIHNAQEAIQILKEAALICNNVSADFIYALPNDSLEIWKYKLEKILKLLHETKINHTSLYQLVIEENTVFFEDVAKKKWHPMNDDLQSQLYQYTQEQLEKIGWEFYEISNASLKTVNNNWQCKHNLIYWRYKNYLGIGPGAHSRMEIDNKKIKFNNFKTPNRWLNEANNSYMAKEDYTILTNQEIFKEKLLMGLRLKEGVKIMNSEYEFFDEYMLKVLEENQIIKLENNLLKIEKNHILKLNSIICTIIKPI